MCAESRLPVDQVALIRRRRYREEALPIASGLADIVLTENPVPATL
jgi:hypothetical protein